MIACPGNCLLSGLGRFWRVGGVEPEAERRVWGAFTLVELLVVIAVVAVLAGMLFPGVVKSKSTAKRAVCLNNLRQMCIAAQVYVEANREYYPVAYTNAVENGVSVAYGWDITTVMASPVRVKPGLLWEGQGTEKVQECPAYRRRGNWVVEAHTGYNYNTSYIGHGEFESIPWPAKAGAVLQPTRTVLFGDGEYSGGANKFMRAPWPNPAPG